MISHTLNKKEALLADLEQSIIKALDAKTADLAGALYRLQGSAKGWCDLEDCGDCPLAPLMCVNGMEERVAKLIDDHHANKKIEIPSEHKAIQQPLSNKTPATDSLSKIHVDTYFERLQNMLAQKTNKPIIHNFEQPSSGHKLHWQRVNEAFSHPVSQTPTKQNH